MTNATAQAPWGCLFTLSQGPQLCLRCFYNAGDHGWVLSLWPHRVTKAHSFLFLFFNYQMEHKPPPPSTHSMWTFLLWAKPSCVTSKAALHPPPKSSALSTTRTGPVSSVTTDLRACGAGGKQEETQPQVVFPVPSSALALISAACCGGKWTLTKTLPEAGWKTTVTQHLQKNPNC